MVNGSFSSLVTDRRKWAGYGYIAGDIFMVLYGLAEIWQGSNKKSFNKELVLKGMGPVVTGIGWGWAVRRWPDLASSR